MTPFAENEDAVSFGIVVLAALLLVGTVAIMGLTPAVNSFVEVFNNQVDAGQVSQQRADAMSWNVRAFESAYIWLLLAGLAWGVVRALEEKGG